MTNANINVTVDSLNHHTLSGTVSGLLSGRSLVIQYTSSNAVTVTGNGCYTLTNDVVDAMPYKINMINHPVAQRCMVSNSSGSANGADITNIDVTCEDKGTKLDASYHSLRTEPEGTLWAWAAY